MLTLQELKQIVPVPAPGQKIPTAKKLKKSGSPVVTKTLNTDVEIAAYPCGYVLYSAGGTATVFSIDSCRDYFYDSGEKPHCIAEKAFDHECWYLRLILEGEDRLCRNREAREQRKTVSYSAVSEEWKIMAAEESMLEQMVRHETVLELFGLLTSRQKVMVRCFYLEQKTQKQIAEELGISISAVSKTLSQAVRKMRRDYPYGRVTVRIEKQTR